MKIIHYALFASSQSLADFLHERGVDPDTVYLNDAKFMKRVFKILVSPPQPTHTQVSIFGYRPSMTLDQFFRFGFAEQKMILCCDVINLARKAQKDIKLTVMLNRKRSGASRAASAGRFTVQRADSPAVDYQFERDSVQKVARVSRVDGQSLMEEAERTRASRLRSPGSTVDRRTSTNSSAKKQSASSRFRDTVGATFSNCHRHGHTEEDQVRRSLCLTTLAAGEACAAVRAPQVQR